MKVKELLFLLDGNFTIHVTEDNDWMDLDQDTSVAKIREIREKTVTNIIASGGVIHVYAE